MERGRQESNRDEPSEGEGGPHKKEGEAWQKNAQRSSKKKGEKKKLKRKTSN